MQQPIYALQSHNWGKNSIKWHLQKYDTTISQNNFKTCILFHHRTKVENVQQINGVKTFRFSKGANVSCLGPIKQLHVKSVV